MSVGAGSVKWRTVVSNQQSQNMKPTESVASTQVSLKDRQIDSNCRRQEGAEGIHHPGPAEIKRILRGWQGLDASNVVTKI